MKRKSKFKIGDVVWSSGNAVLVTGGSKHKEYPSFAGVVIAADKDYQDEMWAVGYFSDTWAKSSFFVTKLTPKNLSKFVIFGLNL